jgi:hypothetical protein
MAGRDGFHATFCSVLFFHHHHHHHHHLRWVLTPDRSQDGKKRVKILRPSVSLAGLPAPWIATALTCGGILQPRLAPRLV